MNIAVAIAVAEPTYSHPSRCRGCRLTISAPTTAKPIETGTRTRVSGLVMSGGRPAPRPTTYAATNRATQAAGAAHASTARPLDTARSHPAHRVGSPREALGLLHRRRP